VEIVFAFFMCESAATIHVIGINAVIAKQRKLRLNHFEGCNSVACPFWIVPSRMDSARQLPSMAMIANPILEGRLHASKLAQGAGLF
jgi:hypothetical protein